MDPSLTYLFLALACLVALWLLSPTFRALTYRAIIGPPNLRFEELPDIFSGWQSFAVDHNPRKKLSGAERSVQVYHDKVSIIYHTTKYPAGLSETVDIAYRGKAGMIFTLSNGTMTSFERIGGASRKIPELTPEHKDALERFMTRLRSCFTER